MSTRLFVKIDDEGDMEEKRHRKSNGQALHEYAIAIALIALLAVGALQLLGWNISNLFIQAADGRNSETSQLMNLVGSGGQKSKPAINLSHVTLQIDPKTGQMLIQDTGSGGKNATSIDGGVLIAAASDKLDELSRLRTYNGKPVPEDISKLIKQLSEIGDKLGIAHDKYTTNRPAIDQLNDAITAAQQEGRYGDPPYPIRIIDQVAQYAENSIQFYSIYSQIQGMIAQNPELSGLQGQVSDLAGAISAVTYNNVGKPFLGQVHTESILPNDLAVALQNAPTTAQYLQQLESASEGMPPAQREAFYRQTMLGLVEGFQTGTPVSEGSGLTLNLDVLGVSADVGVGGSQGLSVGISIGDSDD